MRILSLDTATRTGWAVGTSNGLIISSGVLDCSIRTQSTKTIEADHPGLRFAKFRDGLTYLLKKYKVNLVSYESVVGGHHAGGNTSLIQKGLEAILLEESSRNQTPCWPFAAGTIKKWATGSGLLTHESKQKMIELAVAEFKRVNWIMKPNGSVDDNQCDAIWIFDLCAHVVQGLREDLKHRKPGSEWVLCKLTHHARIVANKKWLSRAKSRSIQTS